MPIELLGIIVVLIAVAAAAVWLIQRSRGQSVIEEDDSNWAQGLSGSRPEVLTRESLMHRDRTLDPTRWDDSADSPPTKPVPVNPPPGSPEILAGAKDAPEAAVDSSFIESLRQRNRDVTDSADVPPLGSDETPPSGGQPSADDCL